MEGLKIMVEKKKKKLIGIYVRFTEEFLKKMRKFLREKGYKSYSEFIRDLIREKLEKEGYL